MLNTCGLQNWREQKNSRFFMLEISVLRSQWTIKYGVSPEISVLTDLFRSEISVYAHSIAFIKGIIIWEYADSQTPELEMTVSYLVFVWVGESFHDQTVHSGPLQHFMLVFHDKILIVSLYAQDSHSRTCRILSLHAEWLFLCILEKSHSCALQILYRTCNAIVAWTHTST